MILKNPKTQILRPRKGFSMVEMLAVVLIMAVLLTGGAVGIRNMSTGKGSSVGIAMVETLINEARDTAIGKKERARLCIVNFEDGPNAEDIFRSKIFVAHLYDNPGTPNTESDWVISNRPVSLPKGTYFSEEFSRKFMNSNVGEKFNSRNMNFRYINQDGSTRAANSGAKVNGQVFVYEFNAEGILVDFPGNDRNANESDITRATFVVGTGARPRGEDPILSGDKDLDGIVVWKKGTISRIRSVDQIATGTPTKF